MCKGMVDHAHGVETMTTLLKREKGSLECSHRSRIDLNNSLNIKLVKESRLHVRDRGMSNSI